MGVLLCASPIRLLSLDWVDEVWKVAVHTHTQMDNKEKEERMNERHRCCLHPQGKQKQVIHTERETHTHATGKHTSAQNSPEELSVPSPHLTLPHSFSPSRSAVCKEEGGKERGIHFLARVDFLASFGSAINPSRERDTTPTRTSTSGK